MARKIDKWEAETDPPTTHDTLFEAVAAELAQMLGHNGGSESQVPALTQTIVANHGAFIVCLKQLQPEIPTGPTKRPPFNANVRDGGIQ
jgi:hypothetical protein